MPASALAGILARGTITRTIAVTNPDGTTSTRTETVKVDPAAP